MPSQIMIPTTGGHTLAAYDLDPHLQGNPIIILHGITSTLNANRDLYNMFAGLGHRYALTLPGHAPATYAADWLQNLTVDSITAALIPAIQKLGAGGRITLAGLSTGAFFAMKIAALKQLPVVLLVAISPFLSGTWSGELGRHQGLLCEGPSGQREFQKLYEKGGFHNPDSIDPNMLSSFFRAMSTADLTDSVSRIEIPTLLVRGEDDPVMPAADVSQIQQLLKDSELVVIKQAGHRPHVDQPQEFRRVISAWFSKHQR